MYVFIYINTHTYNSPTSFYSLSSIYIYIHMYGRCTKCTSP